jgi:hypothetical protein
MKKVCILLPIPFMLLGIVEVLRKRNLNVVPLLAYLFLMPLLYYVTHVNERYRFPMEPVMLVFACCGFCVLAQWVKEHVAVFLDRTMGNWSVGVMEYWSNGECKSKSIIPHPSVPLCAGWEPQRSREKD